MSYNSTEKKGRKYHLHEWLLDFIIPKIKFAATSAVATAADYFLYLVLEAYLMPPVHANLVSQSAGMVINFILQRKFVFMLKRKLYAAFLLSVLFSIIGIGLGTSLIYLLTRIIFFDSHQYITKAIVTGIIFFYNFYTKRFAFEKQTFSMKRTYDKTQ